MSTQELHGFPASEKAVSAVWKAESELAGVFHKIDAIEAHNQWKVLQAFQLEGVAQRHFSPTTGYGYDDIGRDTLERVFARSFGAEDALVRPQIVNGTHALYLMLSGVLRSGDTLLCVTGKPYDTLEQAIGGEEGFGSLQEYGIKYREVPLSEDAIDIPRVLSVLMEDKSVRMVYAQRSRGYAWREAVSVDAFAEVFQAVKRCRPDVIIAVDNCYGEFAGTREPAQIGADLMAGSLIKNPGGGLAPTGGYIAGKRELVERIGHRLTVPGMGREVGSYAGSYLPFYQGLFLAPHVTAQALKSAALFARTFENAGMVTMPKSDAERSDIIQSLRLPTKEALIAFCQSIQKAAPIDSSAAPEPWDMPGYSHQVIMAAGTFIQGASIELSADAPIREPYVAYIQGALTYAHGRLGAMLALDALQKSGVNVNSCA
ncbi:MAG TPA: methionine gamma-lyase family protein [Feifaniaceae bacterium]|nr:methionine gamma-lyase family protein [Feifaniaceae bacterium]